MFDREHNTQRANSIFLTLVISFMALTLFSPRPLGAGVSKRVLLYSRCTCSHASFRTCFKASSLSSLTCKHDCKKMFQVFQTLTFERNYSTETFTTGSSASQHSGVTPSDFTRFPADFTAVVVLRVTVDLVSMFLEVSREVLPQM